MQKHAKAKRPKPPLLVARPKRRKIGRQATPPPPLEPKPRRRRKPAKPRRTKAAAASAPEQDLKFRQAAFLAAFLTCCSVKKAAEAAKIPRSLHYEWLKDTQYAERFEGAREEAAQVLEDEAVRRAYEGNLEPVYYEGEAVDYILKYSDALLMFLLRGQRPKRYNTSRTELSGPDGGPIDVDIAERLNAARKRLASEPHEV